MQKSDLRLHGVMKNKTTKANFYSFLILYMIGDEEKCKQPKLLGLIWRYRDLHHKIYFYF